MKNLTMMDVIRQGAQPKLSTSDAAAEYSAIIEFALARKAFEASLVKIRDKTSLRSDRMQDILDMLEDAAPDTKAWEEAIDEYRAGAGGLK